MDHVKKMALVPQSMLPTLTNQNALMTDYSYLSELDKEMKDILENRSLAADVKAKMYNPALSRYRSFRQSELQTHQPTKNIAKNSDYSLVTKTLPRTLQPRANLIIETLKNNDDINWTEKNELIYKGRKIAGSNMADLFNSYLRQNKSPEKGSKEFGQALIDSNVPRYAVVNKNLLPLLETDDAITAQEYQSSEEDAQVTPMIMKTRHYKNPDQNAVKKRRREIDATNMQNTTWDEFY